jgi:hypothetical protein
MFLGEYMILCWFTKRMRLRGWGFWDFCDFGRGFHVEGWGGGTTCCFLGICVKVCVIGVTEGGHKGYLKPKVTCEGRAVWSVGQRSMDQPNP